MSIPSGLRPQRLYLPTLLTFSAFLITACLGQVNKKTDITLDARYKKLQRENRDLKGKLAQRDASGKALKEQIAKMKLRLLEKGAQIKVLEERLSSQQKLFDEAIQEVVRAKAKLRSMESKAEAASNMAEAEIALKALKVHLGGGEKDPEVIKADALLKMSTLEFKKDNYGGALYLSSQAKSHIKAQQMRVGGPGKITPIKGEVLFVQAVPLQVLKKSNLREEPDRTSRVLTTVDKGAWVVGYSYKGEWVRVRSEDGTSGWIFQTLVGGR